MKSDNQATPPSADMTAVEAAQLAAEHGRCHGAPEVPGDRDDTLRRGGSDEPRGTRTKVRAGAPAPILSEAPSQAGRKTRPRAAPQHAPRGVLPLQLL